MMTDGRLILETENKLLKKLKVLISKRDKLMPAVKDFEAINIDIGDMDGSIKLLKSEADKAHQEMIDFHKQADLIWEDVKPMLAERDFLRAEAEIFMKSGNEYGEFQKFNIQMNPGIRNINLNLGHPDASRLKVVVSPNGWLPLNGDGELIIELIPPLVIPSILISGMSPTTVSLGDTFTIDYTLENTGTSASSAGLLRVVGVANNLVFTEVSVPSIDPGNDYSGTVEFPSWEYSQTIDVEFIWNMEDLTVKNQTSVVVDSGSSASFSLPFSVYADSLQRM